MVALKNEDPVESKSKNNLQNGQCKNNSNEDANQNGNKSANPRLAFADQSTKTTGPLKETKNLFKAINLGD